MYINAVTRSAFILAGGRSTRMGADKAFLDWHGRPLIKHAFALARAVAQDVRLIGSRAKFAAYGEVIEDVFPSRGPLAGIHAALAASTSDLNLMLAVDMPFMEPRFLDYLVAQADGSSAVVTVPKVGEHWQPLCAIYRHEFLAPAEAALRAGRNRIDALFPGLPLRILDNNELERLAFAPAMFDNLNTRKEFEQARSRQVRST